MRRRLKPPLTPPISPYAPQNLINAYFVARRNASREARANAAPATNEATPLRRAAIEPTTFHLERYYVP
ncbi:MULTISPECIES: hypothetical protein [unclassified Halomonas]|uniref:hypothetical protein n=1 Tax=unclassified Halomonas TaxID=2609666 RepID=UPI00125DFF2B|nr:MULTISPECIES: hypothetical protein [unclassified Halomonas]